MNEYDFETKLAFSHGVSANTHPDTIMQLIPGCEKVEKAEKERDLLGIDYVATLRRGAEINIDIKAREKGCSRYWRQREPELSLEVWSVMPDGALRGRTGWSLDESKLTDYTLHVFDRSDCEEVFLIPFQLLRMAFKKRIHDWKAVYRVAVQSSGSWRSQCVFVPAKTVIEAITGEMTISQPQETF